MHSWQCLKTSSEYLAMPEKSQCILGQCIGTRHCLQTSNAYLAMPKTSCPCLTLPRNEQCILGNDQQCKLVVHSWQCLKYLQCILENALTTSNAYTRQWPTTSNACLSMAKNQQCILGNRYKTSSAYLAMPKKTYPSFRAVHF